MYLKQSDLFWHLRHEFVKKVMDQSTKQKHPTGTILFREGDPAHCFYTLIKGRVRLTTGTSSGQVVHTVNHAGECFGWSALLDREAYSASAECTEPTELILIQTEKFTRIIEDDPTNGLRFMKRLAGMIGNRLIQSYQMHRTMHPADEVASYGTGQVAESITDIQ